MMRNIDWLLQEDFVRSAYYNEVYKKFDIYSNVSIGLSMEGKIWTGLDVYLSAANGAFTSDELAFATHFFTSRGR